jgi:hypothetical protein
MVPKSYTEVGCVFFQLLELYKTKIYQKVILKNKQVNISYNIIMVLFEEIFNLMFDDFQEGDQAYHTEIINYYKKPTIENATILFKKFKLYIPFESQTRKRKNQKQSISKRVTRRQHGGYNTTQSIDIIKQIDVFHDIHDGTSGIIQPVIQDLVLSPLNLSQNDENEIRGECNKVQSNTSFTKKLGDILERLYDMKSSRASLKVAHWNTKLKTLLDTWMNKTSVELVIDGYFDDPSRSGNQNQFICMSILRGACLHAFIMLLIGKYNENFRPSKITDIKILSGLFQSIDLGPTYEKFLKRWVRNFKKVYPNISILNLTSITNPYDIHISVQNNEIIVDTLRVPFVDPKTQTIVTGDINYDIMVKLQSNFYVTYNKQHLKLIFDTYRALYPQNHQTFDTFIQKVIKVNSFRDNYKADVALQRDAFYIANDRLAHIYYSLRAKEKNKVDNSIYYSPHGTNPTDTTSFIKFVQDNHQQTI